MLSSPSTIAKKSARACWRESQNELAFVLKISSRSPFHRPGAAPHTALRRTHSRGKPLAAQSSGPPGSEWQNKASPTVFRQLARNYGTSSRRLTSALDLVRRHEREIRAAWNKNAPVAQQLNVVLPRATHLYWPDLDVDLSVESIEFPERFPLVSRARPDNALRQTRARRRLKSIKRSRGARR